MAAGCAQGDSGVVLVVTSDIIIPDVMDQVSIDVRATGRGGASTTMTRSFPLGSGTGGHRLPLTVPVRRGPTYDLWVEFHVIGLREGGRIVDRWAHGYFSDNNVEQVVVHLSASCVGVACAPGLECVEARCDPIRHPPAPGGDADADAPDDGPEDEGGDAGGDTAEDGDDSTGDDDSTEGDGEAGDAAPEGGACTVDDLPVQVECAPGYRCAIRSAAPPVATVCAAEGAGGNDDPCTWADPPGAGDSCGRYYFCMPVGGEDSCRRFCSDSAGCAAAHGTARSGCLETALRGIFYCTTGCDPRSDDDCRATQACRPLAGPWPGSYSDCEPFGAGTQGASCDSGNDCARRHACMLDPDAGARCYRFCFSHGDCDTVGDTSKCLLFVLDGSGEEIPDFRLCSHQCDPLDDSVCVGGTTCRYLYDAGDFGLASACGSVGPGGQGDACAATADCAAGFTCWNVAGRGRLCLQHCRYPSGSPSCPVGTTCEAMPAGYPPDFGLCL